MSSDIIRSSIIRSASDVVSIVFVLNVFPPILINT